jgi:hypothetical protein
MSFSEVGLRFKMNVGGSYNAVVTVYRITKIWNTGFEVLTRWLWRWVIFWDITPYSSATVNRRFWGTGSKQLCFLSASCWLLAWITLRLWRLGRYVLPKRRLTFTWLHGIISQNTEFFIVTDERTSNPTLTGSNSNMLCNNVKLFSQELPHQLRFVTVPGNFVLLILTKFWESWCDFNWAEVV